MINCIEMLYVMHKLNSHYQQVFKALAEEELKEKDRLFATLATVDNVDETNALAPDDKSNVLEERRSTARSNRSSVRTSNLIERQIENKGVKQLFLRRSAIETVEKDTLIAGINRRRVRKGKRKHP